MRIQKEEDDKNTSAQENFNKLTNVQVDTKNSPFIDSKKSKIDEKVLRNSNSKLSINKDNTDEPEKLTYSTQKLFTIRKERRPIKNLKASRVGTPRVKEIHLLGMNKILK